MPTISPEKPAGQPWRMDRTANAR
jgi:hypothetical protein